jgi:O-antigen/teichoic acid export membrane protein
MFIPLFFLFFPQYEQSKQAFGLIALTLALYTTSFGYSGVLIAKGKEKILSYAALLSLIVNVIAICFLVNVINVAFYQVVSATMLAYLFFVVITGYLGQKYIGMRHDFLSVLRNIFPLQLLIPFLSSLCLMVFKADDVYFILPLLLFVCFNIKTIITLKQVVRKIILNANAVDI